MRLEVISRQPTSNTKRCCYLYMAHGMARGHGMMVESSWQTHRRSHTGVAGRAQIVNINARGIATSCPYQRLIASI